MFKLPSDLYLVLSPEYLSEIRGVSKSDAIDQMLSHGQAGEPFRVFHITMDAGTNLPETTTDVTEDMTRELMDGYFFASDIPQWLGDLDECYLNELKVL